MGLGQDIPKRLYGFPVVWCFRNNQSKFSEENVRVQNLSFTQNPADGWFKLLTQEEGEFYNVPVADATEDLLKLKSQMKVSILEIIPQFLSKILFPHSQQKTASQRKSSVKSDNISQALSKRDLSRMSDFNFIKVLGKGSFGKVF